MLHPQGHGDSCLLSETEHVWLLKAEVFWGVSQNQLFSQGSIKTKTQQAKEMGKKFHKAMKQTLIGPGKLLVVTEDFSSK